MSTANRQTLSIYEQFAPNYIANLATLNQAGHLGAYNEKLDLMQLIRTGTAHLDPRSARVIEIGSGSGYGTRLLAELGFARLTPSDAVDSFLYILATQQFAPIKFNLLTDHFDGQYDFVFAWRTFVHFNRTDAALALAKISDALSPHGVLIFNVQDSASHNNLAEAWQDFPGTYHLGAKRYFSFWTLPELQSLLASAHLRPLLISQSRDAASSLWFNLIATRQ